MKKFFIIISVFCASLCAFAQDKQNATQEDNISFALITSAPKSFSNKVLNAILSRATDETMKQKVTMSFAMLGYPNFVGISETEPVVFAKFKTQKGYEQGLAISAQETSQLATMASMQLRTTPTRVGEKLIYAIPPSSSQFAKKYANTFDELARKYNPDFIKLFISGETIRDAFKEYGRGKQPNFEFSDEVKDVVLEYSWKDNGIFSAAIINFKKQIYTPTGKLNKTPEELAYIDESALYNVVITKDLKDLILKTKMTEFFDKKNVCEYAFRHHEGTMLISAFSPHTQSIDGNSQTIAKTSTTIDKLIEIARANPKASMKSMGKKIDLTISITKIAGVPCLKFVCKTPIGNYNAYTTIIDGLELSCTNLERFETLIKKVQKKETNTPSPTILQAIENSDLSIIFSTNAIAKFFDINSDINLPYTVIRAKFNESSIELSTFIENQTINAIAHSITKNRKAPQTNK